MKIEWESEVRKKKRGVAIEAEQHDREDQRSLPSKASIISLPVVMDGYECREVI